MTGQELNQELKLDKFRRVYMIYGDDSYLKHHYTNKIVDKCVSIMPEMNFVRIEGKNMKLQNLFDETEQLPMMSDYRCVLVNDYNFAVAKEDEKKEFIKLISDLPDSTVLILLCDTFEISFKKPEKWGRLIKTADKAGGSINCEFMSVSQLQNKLIKSCEKRHVMLDLSTAKYMIEVCGRQIVLLSSEVEKLCSYKPEGRITKEDIDKVCTKTPDANKYDLSKYILLGNVPKVLQILDDLFASKTKEIDISASIIGGMLDAYRAKMMVEANMSINDTASDFGYNNRKFVLENNARYTRYISVDKLRKCLDIMNETDIKLKSTSDDKRFLLEQEILRMVSVLKQK